MKYVTLIVGPQGSGKTLLAKKLSERFKSYWAIESDLKNHDFFKMLPPHINLVVFDGVPFEISHIKMLAEACRIPHLKLPSLIITSQRDPEELEGIKNITIVRCTIIKKVA